MELTKKQKLAALNYALNQVKFDMLYNNPHGLCVIVSMGVDRVLIEYTSVGNLPKYIPEFKEPDITEKGMAVIGGHLPTLIAELLT